VPFKHYRGTIDIGVGRPLDLTEPTARVHGSPPTAVAGEMNQGSIKSGCFGLTRFPSEMSRLFPKASVRVFPYGIYGVLPIANTGRGTEISSHFGDHEICQIVKRGRRCARPDALRHIQCIPYAKDESFPILTV